MVKQILIGAGIVAVVGAAAYVYYSHQVEVLQNSLTYEIVKIDYRINPTNNDMVDIFITVRIHSDSTIDAEILELSADIYINEKKVAVIQLKDEDIMKATKAGTVTVKKKNILPAKGYSDIDFQVTINKKEIIKDAFSVLVTYLGSKNLTIAIRNGFVRIKEGFIKATVKVDYQTTLQDILSD